MAGFNYAKTTTKASATGLDARPDDYTKEYVPLGAWLIFQLDRIALMLHSH